MIIATNAASAISLDGVEVIEGNLASEACITTCAAGLTSFESSTLISVGGNFSLQNLSSLGSVNLPILYSIGSLFYLDNLPELQNMTLGNLTTFGSFHLVSAPSLTYIFFRSHKYSQNFTDPDPFVEIVGIGSLYDSLYPSLFFNFSTKLSSFIFRENGLEFTIGPFGQRVDYFEIGGASNQTVAVEGVASIGMFNMSGCDELQAGIPSSEDSRQYNTTFDTMLLNGTTVDALDLHLISILNNLTITNNPVLSMAQLPNNLSVQNIEISGNPYLRDTVLGPLDKSTTTWVPWPWGIKNISSMVFDGNFSTKFL